MNYAHDILFLIIQFYYIVFLLFQIMTPQQSVILAATSRKEMEEWLTSIKHSIQTANNSVSNPKTISNVCLFVCIGYCR